MDNSPTNNRTHRPGDPVPAKAPPPPTTGWAGRRNRTRSWNERYRPAPLWKRLFSVIALGSISIASGIMIATLVAAAITAAAIALQSLFT
ncbi:MAG: hypothetical protein GY708_12825 [Actinomycetia bacterium]|nr:hypothetical protein [Actinomycetes bacterium]MCP4961547.1 hypothetical protein [Actinomycetes bacterium]